MEHTGKSYTTTKSDIDSDVTQASICKTLKKNLC